MSAANNTRIGFFNKLFSTVAMTTVAFALALPAYATDCRRILDPSDRRDEINTEPSQYLLNSMAADLGIPRSEIQEALQGVFYHYGLPLIIDQQIMQKAQYEAGEFTMKLARSKLVFTPKNEATSRYYDRLTFVDIADGQEIGFIDYTIPETDRSRIFISEIKGDHHALIRPITKKLLAEMMARHPTIRTLSVDIYPADMYHVRQARKQGLSPEDSIKATPIYQSLVSIGFTKIIKGKSSIAPDDPGFFIEK